MTDRYDLQFNCKLIGFGVDTKVHIKYDLTDNYVGYIKKNLRLGEITELLNNQDARIRELEEVCKTHD